MWCGCRSWKMLEITIRTLLYYYYYSHHHHYIYVYRYYYYYYCYYCYDYYHYHHYYCFTPIPEPCWKPEHQPTGSNLSVTICRQRKVFASGRYPIVGNVWQCIAWDLPPFRTQIFFHTTTAATTATTATKTATTFDCSKAPVLESINCVPGPLRLWPQNQRAKMRSPFDGACCKWPTLWPVFFVYEVSSQLT